MNEMRVGTWYVSQHYARDPPYALRPRPCLQIRSEFDNLLLRHAEESGVQVFEETKVTEIKFAETKGPEIRPTSAIYTRNGGGTGEIRFDYLVDASGRNGIMSTKVCRVSHMPMSDNLTPIFKVPEEPQDEPKLA